MPVTQVRVDGLKEFRSALKRAGDDFPKELQKTNKAVAGKVAEKVAAAYSSRYTSRSGAGAGSIRALASATRAQVAMGSERALYVAGQNFGSAQGPRKRQFPPRREPDYFLYTVVERENDAIVDAYDEALEALIHRLAEGS